MKKSGSTSPKQRNSTLGQKKHLEEERDTIRTQLNLASTEPSDLQKTEDWAGVPEAVLKQIPRLSLGFVQVRSAEAVEETVRRLRAFDIGPCQRYAYIFNRSFLQETKVQEALTWLLRIALVVKGSAAKKAQDALLQLLRKPVWEENRGTPKKLTSEKRKAIIADCEKWLPICQGLNKDFKRLWEEPAYSQNSPRARIEAKGHLAEKFSIFVDDVSAIETYLQQKSRRSTKTTPWDAMLRMVARQPEHGGVGEKTVENIYMAYKKTTIHQPN